jgi:hypothetical protein
LHDPDPIARIALESHVLIETTATWEGIAFQLREAFTMHLPIMGGTQGANMTGLIDHAEVFDHMALLLASVVVLLFLYPQSVESYSRPQGRAI